MPLAEIKASLAAYEAKVTDREAKQEIHVDAMTALNSAVTAEQTARNDWIAALQAEHAAEDALEALIVAHEPPALPS